MAVGASHARPFAIIIAKANAFYEGPDEDVWYEIDLQQTLEDFGGDYIERVLASDSRFRVLEDGWYQVRWQTGGQNIGGDRQGWDIRITVNGSPVTGVYKSFYSHDDGPCSGSVSAVLNLNANDQVACEINYQDQEINLNPLYSRFELMLLAIRS